MKKGLLLTLIIFSFFLSQGQNYYTVHVNQPPALVTNAGANVSTCFYDSIQIGSLNVATGGTAPYTYSWFPTYGLSDPSIPNPMALPDDTTTYTISVTDSNNCTSWSQMVVMIDPCSGIQKHTNKFEFTVFPNPNTEKVFNILLSGKRLNTEYDLFVYNIYGKSIYTDIIKAEDKLFTGVLDLRAFLDKGIYILEISNKHIKNYQKIIIQ